MQVSLEAKLTPSITSDVPAQRTIIAGRLLTIPLKTARAASYPSSSGWISSPRRLVANSCTASSTRSLPRGIPNWRYWSAMSRRPFPEILFLGPIVLRRTHPCIPRGDLGEDACGVGATRIAAKITAYPPTPFLLDRRLGRTQGRIKELWSRPRNTHLAPRQSPARSPSERLYGSG